MRMHTISLSVLASATVIALWCVSTASGAPQAKPATKPAAAPVKAPSAAPKAPTPAGRGAAAPGAGAHGAAPAAAGGHAPSTAAGRGASGAPGAGRGASGAAGGRGATGAAGAGGRGGAGAVHNSTGPAARGGGHVPPGGREVHGANGNHATFDRSGRPREVHARGMDIHHGPGGTRTIVRERPGGVRVVSNRYGHGYIAHPYAYHGVTYIGRITTTVWRTADFTGLINGVEFH